jgi:hypothetical protein
VQEPYQPIDDEDDPIHTVWRAGCDGERAAAPANLIARLDGATANTAPPVPEMSIVAATTVPAAGAPVAPPLPSGATSGAPGGANRPSLVPTAADVSTDPRRADHCVRFTERVARLGGEGLLTNGCAFDVEVAYCYKGGAGKAFDCPTPTRGRRVDTIRAGRSLPLPDYARSANRGVTFVVCQGAVGAVIPRLDAAGTSGCF